MAYLLIAFLIAVVLSPLAWMKTSPAQARISAFRKKALSRGVQVQLVPDIEADEEARRPEAVRYFLAYPVSRSGELRSRFGNWTLTRRRRRGSESPWADWKWFRGPAPEHCLESVGSFLNQMPDTVYGIRAESAGIGVYLDESGDVESVDTIVDGLRTLAGLE